MGRPGPKKTLSYGLEFKRAAVQLSYRPGIQVQVVAEALDIHPYMLSRWRKEFRDGVLRGRVSTPHVVKGPVAADVKRFQALQRKYAVLEEEHALLKKLIRFSSARKPTPSHSLTPSGRRSR